MGIRPTGFDSFELTPQLPDEWDTMSLRNIHGFGKGTFDLTVERIAGPKIRITIVSEGKTRKINSEINKTVTLKL